jgi:hypothetical protein
LTSTAFRLPVRRSSASNCTEMHVSKTVRQTPSARRYLLFSMNGLTMPHHGVPWMEPMRTQIIGRCHHVVRGFYR